jgi:ubiquitin C-terminal hydrolase
MIKMKESPRLASPQAFPAPSIDMPEKPTYFLPDTDIPSTASKSTASKSTATSTEKSTSASQSESSSASSQSSPKDQPPLAMLKNQSNSCFIDSVLIALMHIKKENNPILKDILDSANSYTNVKNRLTLAKYGNSIKDELVSIYNKIHADSKEPIYICGSIRSLFDKFDKEWVFDKSVIYYKIFIAYSALK